jgi:hypothetical protein
MRNAIPDTNHVFTALRQFPYLSPRFPEPPFLPIPLFPLEKGYTNPVFFGAP